MHCAACVTFANDYSGLKRENTLATMELLGASVAHGAIFHFVSTMGIFGDGPMHEGVDPVLRLPLPGTLAIGKCSTADRPDSKRMHKILARFPDT